MKTEYPWKVKWTRRTVNAVQFIPEYSSVVDVGGGLGELKEVRPDLLYLSIDVKKWTPETVVADFEKEFPWIGGKVRDFVVCLGVIEYASNPQAFLHSILDYGKALVISYRDGPMNMGRKNQMTIVQFRELLSNSRWAVVTEYALSDVEKIWYCERKS